MGLTGTGLPWDRVFHLSISREVPTGPAPPQPTFSAPQSPSPQPPLLSGPAIHSPTPNHGSFTHVPGSHCCGDSEPLPHGSPLQKLRCGELRCPLAAPAHAGSSVPEACLPPRHPPRPTDWLLPSAPRRHCSSLETVRGIFTAFFTQDFYLLIENGYYLKVCFKIHHISSMFPESRSAHLCLVAF